MNLDTFCVDVVPDFTPLGGNRPDCAVVMAAAISLVEDQQSPSSLSLVLPPDVLDTAMAATCATVIIRSASDVVPPPHGYRRDGRLSCRLEIGCDAAFEGFRNLDGTPNELFYQRIPWRNFKSVSLQVALPGYITSCPGDFLSQCRSLATLDLRNTKLQTVGDYFMWACASLEEVYLPETLHTVAEGFFHRCSSLVSIDLQNSMLQSVGKAFCTRCTSLTEVCLPATLMTIGDVFLSLCNSLVSIDLRNTKLHTVGIRFLFRCEQLTSLHLPDTLQTVGVSFLEGCKSLPQETIANIKCSIEERRSLADEHGPAARLVRQHIGPNSVRASNRGGGDRGRGRGRGGGGRGRCEGYQRYNNSDDAKNGESEAEEKH